MNSKNITDDITLVTESDNPYSSVLLPGNIKSLKSGKIVENKLLNINISEILKEDYPKIYESLTENDYKLSDEDTCFYFFAIPDENNENVGFLTLDIESEELLSLTNIYVIPEARGQNHFLKILEYFTNIIDGIICIKNPNKSLIEILKQTELCSIIANRFVLSAIPFIFNIVSWNESINDVYEYNYDLNISHNKIAMTTVYDIKLSAPILVNRSCNILDNLNNYKNEQYCLMAISRYDDNKEYDCINLRQNDNWIKSGKYFKKVLKLLNKSKLWI